MKVIGMRWGYTGTQMACGPIEGDSLVEMKVEEKGKTLYFLEMRMDIYEALYLLPFSAFDGMMKLDEDLLEKVQGKAIFTYDFETDSEEDVEQSEYVNAVRLMRTAMKGCYALSSPSDDDAAKFIAPYIGKDLNDMDIPPYEAEAEDDDDYDEDEEDNE